MFIVQNDMLIRIYWSELEMDIVDSSLIANTWYRQHCIEQIQGKENKKNKKLHQVVFLVRTLLNRSRYKLSYS